MEIPYIANNLIEVNLLPKHITLKESECRYQQRGAILWLTGLSGSGKTTLSQSLAGELRGFYDSKALITILDGDVMREGLNKDLSFSMEDRKENIRRTGEVAKLFLENNFLVIVALISPFRDDRDQIRRSTGPRQFIEIFVDCPLNTCEKRDPKNLYQKARNGEILSFTGISSPYEPPLKPEIHLRTDKQTVEQCVDLILDYLVNTNIVKTLK